MEQEKKVHGEEKKQESILRKWDLAVLIAILPILGYAATFSYEFGVSLHYRYPISWISLDSSTVTRTSFFLFFLLLITALLTYLYRLSSGEYFKEYLLITGFVASCIAIFSPFMSQEGTIIAKFYNSLYFFLSCVLPILAMFRIGYLLHNNKIEKLMIVLLTAVLIIPLIEGNSLSREKQTYSIIKGEEKSKYVIVNVLKDKLLIAPVNLTTKTITPEYTLIEQKTDFEPQNKKDGDQLVITPVKVGKLNVDNYQTSEVFLKSN
ncbi:hypothetical protein [Priestia megaterium]|uniref:hypothetical protein n=1 Tax=Priestia megaterium TaxID=1404 RepID=UPI001128BC09|nr:hypothetical protein [Priestia megaterium]TPF14235.1 hypothetical protein CBE78_26370 [Priestia megaterium]TPF19540.1 hypothetical protein CBE79_26545 [Priestia megaterium]